MITGLAKGAENAMEQRFFRLLWRANQVMNAAFAKEGAKLTLRQVTLLSLLQDGRAYSQTDIRDLTGMDRSTISEMARRMQAAGFVSRVRPNPSDGDSREIMVQITRSGRAALRATETCLTQAEQSVLKHVALNDRQGFTRGLRGIADAR